jgi:hypothetical protein
MMRKTKRPTRWERPSADSTKELDGERDDSDDEIIELEHVIEPDGDGFEDDDELGLDEEILDEETGLGLGYLESKIGSEDEFLLEGDLLKDFPFFKDRKADPEAPQEQDIAIEHPEEPVPGLFLNSDEGVPEEAESEGEALAAEEMKPEVFALPLEPLEPPAEASDSLEEFIAQIESRLVDAIREIVESRLPEMVRTVLKEELERLKHEEELEA